MCNQESSSEMVEEDTNQTESIGDVTIGNVATTMLFTNNQKSGHTHQDLKHELFQIKEEIINRMNLLEKEMRYEIKQIKLKNASFNQVDYEKNHNNQFINIFHYYNLF